MNAFHVIIPARLKSTRLKEKPLLDLNGKPMIVRVAEIAQQSLAQSVTVACDDEKIKAVCATYNIPAILTSPHHQNGTERLNEAASLLNLSDSEIIVNLQGDEPLMNPKALDLLAETLKNSNAPMATLARAFNTICDFRNPNKVKVVVNQQNEALYFSRAPIPFLRDFPENLPECAFHHIGIYAYFVGFLKEFTALSPTPLENIEKLEQLRALEHGFKIALQFWEGEEFVGVDTEEDAEKVRALLKLPR